MCLVPALIGKAVGGRTGAIFGAGLGGGIPAAFAASKLVKKKDKPSSTFYPATEAPTGF